MINFFYNLNPVIQAFLASTFTFLITAFGAASVFLFKKFNKTILDSFLSFSAGVMIAPNTTHEYEMDFRLKGVGGSQNEDKLKTFSGYVEIYLDHEY